MSPLRPRNEKMESSRRLHMPNEFFFVCFNDECPYFVDGWERMWKEQATHASYRCRLDPDSGKYMPLPVWSNEALKEDIME